MRCIVFGAGNDGLWLIKVLKEMFYDDIVVKYFYDNNKELQGKFLEGILVLNEQELEKYSENDAYDCVIIAVRNKHLDGIVDQLNNINLTKIFYVPEYLFQKQLNGLTLNELIFKVEIKKPRLTYLEFHVTDKCNLNCKGCGHFCNLVSDFNFPSINHYKNDLVRLKELFWGIQTIRLLGGEPLLNPNLNDFIEITRLHFPDCDLRVVTNGLDIISLNPDVFQTMKNCHCRFDITLYKPTIKIKKEIEEKIIDYGVDYHFSAPIETFFKKLSLKNDNDAKLVYESCISRNCAYLRDGIMTACPAPQLIDILNQYFGKEFHTCEEDFIDIYNIRICGDDIKKILSSPMKFCAYCKREDEWFDWEPVGKKVNIYDWIIT